METDGSNRRNLTNTPGFDAMPRWSPDGNSLVWNSDRSGNHEVYVATFDGTDLGPPINVSNDSANADLQACWSPDSQKILFVKKDSDPMSGIGDIYSVERDGTPPPTRLTTHSSLDDFPSWRP
jgi:TolB protein